MKRIALVFTLTCSTLVPLASSAIAQVAGSPLLNVSQAEQLGLVRAWYTRADVDASRGGIDHVTLYTSRTRYFTVYRVNYQGREVQFSERQPDRWGNPIGSDEAQRLAETKLRELEELGYQPTMNEVEVPESTLYVQTNLGLLNAIDAHTGLTRWVTRVGKPFYPTLAPAANDQWVVASSGSQLLWLEAPTGRITYTRPGAKVPIADPALSDQFVYVPTMDGTLEAYRIEDRIARTPWRYHGLGLGHGEPLVTDRRVSWVTDRGMLYVGLRDRNRLVFDMELDGPAVGSPVYVSPGLLVIATSNGFVYAVHQIDGTMHWRFTTGGDIRHTPLAVDGMVLIGAHRDRLYALRGETGELLWSAPGIDRPIAVTADHVYAMSDRRELVALDRGTGKVEAALPAASIDLVIPNNQTDRLFVGSKRGLIQCLHEPQNTLPLSYQAPLAEESSAEPPSPPAEPVAPARPRSPQVAPPQEEEPVDPFENFPLGDQPPAGGVEGELEEPSESDQPLDDPFGTPFPDSDLGTPF